MNFEAMRRGIVSQKSIKRIFLSFEQSIGHVMVRVIAAVGVAAASCCRCW